MKKSTLLFFIIALTLFSARAQHWTGSISSDWNNSGNWSSWPLNGNNITIDPLTYSGSAASPVISAASVFTPDRITLQNAAMLSIQANLSTGDNISLIGAGTQMTISAGTINVAPGNNGRFIVSDGAAVTMNNGTLNADQRLLVELGGVFTLNGGQVNAGEVIALSDGNTAGSSLFDMNGGTVTTGVELAFENELGLYSPTFDMSGGTLAVNGDVTWFGTAPGTGAPKLISTGGSVIISGNVLNLPASSVNIYLHAGGTSSISISGALIDMNQAADTLLQSGSSSLILLNTNSWNNHGTVLSTAGTFFGGTTTLTGTGAYTFYDLTIASGKSLIHAAPANITVKGSFMNNGVFTANSNGILFAGSAPQIIGGSASTAFHNMTVSNPTGITLNKPESVSGMLNLMDGPVTTSAAALLTLTDNALSTTGSDSSYVNGPMKKTGDDSFIFPLGKNGKWRRLALGAPLNINAEFTVEYFDNGYSMSGPVTVPLTSVSTLEYWNVEQTVTGDPYHVELYWEDALMSGIGSCADLSIAHWDGLAWIDLPATASGICSGAGNGLLSADTLIVGNGPFTFGSAALTTGIEIVVAKEQEIKVYPNPAASSQQITVSIPFTAGIMEISDLSGRIILTGIINTSTILLPDNLLMPGVYCITAKDKTKQAVKKLVVQ